MEGVAKVSLVVHEVSEKILLKVSDIGSGSFPDYQGDYVVVPKVLEQVLPTKNKAMRDNLNVKEIPYHEVSNEMGTTVVIGGIM